MKNRFHTKGYQGYSVEFSPFFQNKLAIASAANFGIVGNGRLFISDLSGIQKSYDTQDGLFDLAWSENHENHIITSGGDGSIKLWDVSLNDYPIHNYTEHIKEVFSVNWNLVTKNVFISGSWDLSIKLWNPEMPKSLQTWQEHTACIYQTTWCPHNPDTFASASGDQTVKLWDVRQPRSVNTIHAHTNEILALDWNKYKRDTIVTGSVDTTIKEWDLKMPNRPLNEIKAHDYAVRRLKCSPHDASIVASVSYDMTMRLWNLTNMQQIYVHDDHTEFVLGVDFNLFQPGLLATCAWDGFVDIFHP